MIVAFHSPKGGVGTTTLAALFCILAREFDIPVAGVASPESPDFEPWLRAADIAYLAPEAAQADADLELLVLDVPSRSTPTMKPDVWVIPISDRRTLARTIELSASLAGELVWIGNRRQVTRDDIPDPFRPRVHVAPSIRGSHSIAAAAAEHRVPWIDPVPLSRSSGAALLRDALEWLLDHLCEPGDHTLARRGASPVDPANAPFAPRSVLSPPPAEPPPPSRPRPRRYPVRILDEYRPDPVKDFARLREIYRLPDPNAPRGTRSAHFRLPTEIDAALGELAEAHGCSRTHVVCALIEAEHRRLQRRRSKAAGAPASRPRAEAKPPTGPAIN